MRLYLDRLGGSIMFLGRFPTSPAETHTAPFHIVWRVYPRLDLIQLSGFLSGITALARSNAVSFSVEFMNSDAEGVAALMELVVTEKRTGRVRNIVLDFYDKADRVVPGALQFSDLYFKRPFGPETPTAGDRGGGRIAPLGVRS